MVVVFGAGKHTRRCWRAIRIALKKHQIVAICDDASRCDSIAGLEILTPAEAAAFEPDIVVVSSDAYEAALSRRAHQAFCDVPVWCIYDTTLETSVESRSACCTASMNPANSSDTSSNELVEAALGRPLGRVGPGELVVFMAVINAAPRANNARARASTTRRWNFRQRLVPP
jgi:hypothetical protein